MVEVFEILKSFLKYIGPLAIIGFGILIAWGLVKWFGKMKEAVYGLSSNPASLIFAILLIAAGLYFWFSYLLPLFN